MALICLSGAPGTGKSTVANELNQRGWKVIGAGDFMRWKARELGITIAEMQRQAEEDGSIDRMIDLASRNLDIGEGENVVLDARLGFAFAKSPNLTVQLVCDEVVAGQRVYAARRSDERYPSVEAAVEALRLRRELEAARYLELYGVSYEEHVFDLTFETANTPPDAIADIIERHARELDDSTRMGAIGPFRGEHEFLSNMWPCKAVVGGIEYSCSESAYQAQKTVDESLREKMAQMDGRAAKAFAQGIDVRDDWEHVKWSAMRSAVSAKFGQNEDLGIALMGTDGYALIEYNDWHDGYWGVCTCEECGDKPAMNMLGRILQSVRGELLRHKGVGGSQTAEAVDVDLSLTIIGEADCKRVLDFLRSGDPGCLEAGEIDVPVELTIRSVGESAANGGKRRIRVVLPKEAYGEIQRASTTGPMPVGELRRALFE